MTKQKVSAATQELIRKLKEDVPALVAVITVAENRIAQGAHEEALSYLQGAQDLANVIVPANGDVTVINDGLVGTLRILRKHLKEDLGVA